MADPACRPLSEVLTELDGIAPGAPLLALGQTVFWDETVKAELALRGAERGREFVAGVHDTDYLAKRPGGVARSKAAYSVLPHNDTTTKGLWSAAGEFSTLFGSETVVTRELMRESALRMDRLLISRPDLLDHATEAYGWRGVVANHGEAPIVADVRLRDVFPAIHEAFDWAVDGLLEAAPDAQGPAEELRRIFCAQADWHDVSLSDAYRRLLPSLLEFVAGRPVPATVTRTTELLRFSPETARLPRFALLDLFVRSETRALAKSAYDRAVTELGTGQYTLDQMGTGAIPFDLYVPGRGRGTIRIGTRGLVVNTPRPLFLSLKTPLKDVADLAARFEAAFGPGCVVVGKAISLIGMLGREFVFAFHAGASSYVNASRRFHELLGEAGHPQPVHPILRLRYCAWSAMREVEGWLRLPPILARAFGTEELTAASFAKRWVEVAKAQRELRLKLGTLRSSYDLIRFFDQKLDGGWRALAAEYEELHRRLGSLRASLCGLRSERRTLFAEGRALARKIDEAYHASGRHWRAEIFEKTPSPEAWAERERLRAEIDRLTEARRDHRRRTEDHKRRWQAKVTNPEILQAHERRREIEEEAELTRLRLIRESVIASKGLLAAARRPSGWWFPLLSPDGRWLRATVDAAECWLEPLT